MTPLGEAGVRASDSSLDRSTVNWRDPGDTLETEGWLAGCWVVKLFGSTGGDSSKTFVEGVCGKSADGRTGQDKAETHRTAVSKTA